ncbi:XyeA family putative rSAM-modified RiPP [Yersinia kristensenii]|nr:XyeA family cyclophane-containing RiPP triceptide [Yersinia kristensenii]MDA5487897.1 XyeA family putative rSAM-modified RiPP [Yersinia kristensenii]
MSRLKKEIIETKTVIDVSDTKKTNLSIWLKMFLNRSLAVLAG